MEIKQKIIVAAFSASVLLMFNLYVSPAYAVDYVEITTTDTQTEDNCSFISIDLHSKLWMVCGSTVSDGTPLLNVYDDLGVRKNQTSYCSGTAPTLDQSGTQLNVSFDDASNFSYSIVKCGTTKFEKWRFDKSNNHLDLVGTYTPSSCTMSNVSGARYDTHGYLWFTCSSDIVVAFNPTTMIEKFRSGDLSNGVGTDCALLRSVGVDYINSTTIAVITSCDTADKIESFKVNIDAFNVYTMPSVEPLGSITETISNSANSQMLVDPNHNRVFVDFTSGLLGIDTFTYTSSTFQFVAEHTNFGNAQVQWCYIDAYLFKAPDASNNIYCAGNAAASNNFQAFRSNVTNFYQVANSADILTDGMSRVSTYGGDTVVVSMGQKNAAYQKFGKITNIREVLTSPNNPNPPTPSTNPNGNAINGTCQNGTALQCIGDRNTINQITGGPSITVVSNNLLTGLGIVNGTNTDIKTNGTGLLLMLALGAFFSSITIGTIAVANSKFGAGISYTEIPKEFWLFLVIGVVAASFYLGWIPDLVFYGLCFGLAGLFSFGIYKHIRGNG